LKAKENEKKQKVKKKSRKTPPPSKRGIRLKGPKDCIRLLGRLINKVLVADDEGRAKAEGQLRVVSYAMSNLLKAYEYSELQDRIGKIEEYIKCQEVQRK